MAWNGWCGIGAFGGGIHIRRPSRIFDTLFILILPCWSIAVAGCMIGRVPSVPILQTSAALRYRLDAKMSRTIAVALLVHVCQV